MDEPAVRERAADLVTGRQGRRSDGPGTAGARSAMDAQTTPQEAEIDQFVDGLATWLHLSVTRHDVDELVVVVGPQMLGELRARLSKPVSQAIVDTLEKTMTKLPRIELADRLHRSFPDRMPARPRVIPAAAKRGNTQPKG